MHDDPEPKIRWGPMVAISVAIHAVVLGGAVMLASGSGPRLNLYAPAMSVSLVGPGDLGQPTGGGPVGPVPPPPKARAPEKKSAPKSGVSAVEPPKPKPQESKLAPLKPELKPKKPKKTEKVVRVPKKVRKKKRTPKPRKKTAQRRVKKRRTKKPKAAAARPKKKAPAAKLTGEEAKALARIRKRLLARAERPGAGGGREEPGGPRGGGIGTPGATGAGVNTYKNEIARIFYTAWVLPRSLKTEGLTAVIVIRIDRNGQIIRTEVEKSSGNRFFDESVKRAVAKVQAGGGLPPLPPEFSGDVMEQGLYFDPKMRQGFSR